MENSSSKGSGSLDRETVDKCEYVKVNKLKKEVIKDAYSTSSKGR